MKKFILIAVAVVSVAVIMLRLKQRRPQPARPQAVAPVLSSITNTAAPSTTNSAKEAAPSVPPVAGRFVDLPTDEERRQIEEIRKLDLRSFFHAWIEAGKTDISKQSSIGFVLGGALRERPIDSKALEEMRQFIGDPSNSKRERADLLYILAHGARKESVQIVVDAATSLLDDELRKIAARDIEYAGDSWDDGSFHVELSPVLERVWNSSADAHLAGPAALALAKIGASSGIELLFQAATQGTDEKADIARAVLETVTNPGAVPTVAAKLPHGPPDGPEAGLALKVLADIGNRNAAAAIVQWARKADASAAAPLKEIVENLRTEDMYAVMQSALEPRGAFKAEQNREAIRAALAEWNARRGR